MKDLHGKTVLVTGAASGIGLCTAEEFAKAGATLVLTDIQPEALERAAERLRGSGATVHTRVVDVTDHAQVDALAQWVIDDLGGLDVLVNNAGIGHHGELADTTLATWKKLMDVNFWGPLYHIYAFLPSMTARGSGHIVNVSSGQAFFRMPTWGAYAAIKVAEGAFSEVLHFELRGKGIQVTTVYPFLVNTPFYRGVEGGTWADRLSMKLLPLYSMTPEKVGTIIFKAVVDDRRVEMVSAINLLGFYAHLLPPLAAAMSEVATYFLARKPARAAGGKE
ncbi:MAG: SDR family oxidoreductase [Deltaproteobacteria bacterium]|nr:SDR family oxidoreductase [Deltaproteobacteria bacterium]